MTQKEHDLAVSQDFGRYDMSALDMEQIRQETGGDLFRLMVMTFSYGFLKGRRAEKASRKKRERSAVR